MRYEVDTDNKEITFIADNITLGEIVDFMSNLFMVAWSNYKVFLISESEERAKKIQEEVKRLSIDDIKSQPLENPAKWVYDPNDPPMTFKRDSTGNVDFIY